MRCYDPFFITQLVANGQIKRPTLYEKLILESRALSSSAGEYLRSSRGEESIKNIPYFWMWIA